MAVVNPLNLSTETPSLKDTDRLRLPALLGGREAKIWTSARFSNFSPRGRSRGVKPTTPVPMGETRPSSVDWEERRRWWCGEGGWGGNSVEAMTLEASKSGKISGPRGLIKVVNSAESVSRVCFKRDNAPRLEGLRLSNKGGMDLMLTDEWWEDTCRCPYRSLRIEEPQN